VTLIEVFDKIEKAKDALGDRLDQEVTPAKEVLALK
jgi:hypothetical protein